jgi:hypothetical protein
MTETIRIDSLGAMLAFVENNDLLIATNLLDRSIGHIAVELDYLLRARRENLIPGGRVCVPFMTENAFSLAFAQHYGELLAPFSVSTQLWQWAREIVRADPKRAFDVGSSHFSVEQPETPGSKLVVFEHWLEHRLTQAAARARLHRLIDLQMRTADWRPFKRLLTPSPALDRFLEPLRGNRIALVHVKEQAVNSTAAPTDPETYLPTLAAIRDLGWRPVFIGRERMPAVFRPFGVTNWSECGFATPTDDLALFSVASAALIASSGVAHILELMDLPLVYANSWVINFQAAARRCVYVPATLRDLATGRPLTLTEQIQMNLTQPDEHFFTLATGRHQVEAASGAHIRAAFEETLSFADREPPPLTSAQLRIRNLLPGSVTAIAQSRPGAAWSEAFLERAGPGFPPGSPT